MSPFTVRPAKRENVWLLLGLAGGTGSGKTWSAMALAKGMSGGARFGVCDTENGRASHYADEFAFDVVDLTAPFRPERYQEAIQALIDAGHKVIVVDSMTHEWDGDGGMLEWQEEEFQRMGGREQVKMASWIKPKGAHRKFVTYLLQVPAHIILCFRAAEKVEMVKGANGRMEVVPKRTLTGLDGWVPIAEKALPFELTLSCLLTADKPGYPKPIKLQQQHRAFVPLDEPLTADTGRALAEWAAGVSPDVDPAIEQQARDIEADLLALAPADKQGTVRAAIARHRSANDLGVHIAWLGAQLDRKRAEPGPAQGELA